MSYYCPVNSSTRVAGHFPCQAYLSVYPSCKSAKAELEISSLWGPAVLNIALVCISFYVNSFLFLFSLVYNFFLVLVFLFTDARLICVSLVLISFTKMTLCL